jgi:hypothetical protein
MTLPRAWGAIRSETADHVIVFHVNILTWPYGIFYRGLGQNAKMHPTTSFYCMLMPSSSFFPEACIAYIRGDQVN